jgi:hypothetical protein
VYFEVNTYWKKVGLEATKRSLETFIVRRGDRYLFSEKPLPKGLLWNNPEIKFKFPNGIYIKSMYEETKDGHIYGWLTIGYKQSEYIFAKQLQQELDDYLLERDLIERVC